MPRSDSCVFKVALSRAAMHTGLADSPTINRHAKSAQTVIFQFQRSRRIGGTSNSAGFVTVPQNLRDRELAPDMCAMLDGATLSAASI